VFFSLIFPRKASRWMVGHALHEWSSTLCAYPPVGEPGFVCCGEANSEQLMFCPIGVVKSWVCGDGMLCQQTSNYGAIDTCVALLG
jgi:hypothetical protein